MRRLTFALAMIVMLGIGLLAGSLLMPAAKAQKTTSSDRKTVEYIAPGAGAPGETLGGSYSVPGGGYGQNSPFYPGMTYTYPAPIRWQVVVLPGLSPQSPPLSMLLDTLTGETFYLTAQNGRWYWSRVVH